MKISYAVVSDVGRVRRTNQDNYNLNGQTKPQADLKGRAEGKTEDAYSLFSVCDGMGGEQFGEVAASIAVESLKQYSPEMLWDHSEQYIQKANQAICEFAASRNAYTGTTLTELLLHDNTVRCINVGDSRIYRINRNGIEQLSYDHTEFQVLVESGRLSKEDFANSKAHNHLTQHLGIDPGEMELEPYAVEFPVNAGDRFLLCSDGIYGSVPDEQLKELILAGGSLAQICDRLVETALNQKSKDNVTAMLVEVKETDAFTTGAAEIPADSQAAAPSGSSAQAAPADPKKKSPVLILIAVLLAACIGGGVFAMTHQNPVVPDVTGLSFEEAEKTLEDAGFTVREKDVYDDTVEKGLVISQGDSENQKRKKGAKITLTVSQGKEPVTLTSYTGMDEEAAEAEVSGLGLKVIIQYERSDMPEGTVLDQNPKEGKTVAAGSKVKLTVSGGPDYTED